ncbi:MAG: DegT/DnrJ/EryC1/StrS family aminotransferase [Planctomycetes bacterium]|nr:DegT/DnrJ/EryC1/StrS family aminotransferase [Planctomycetota bacterium]
MATNWRIPLTKANTTKADIGAEALAFRSGVRFGGPRQAEFEQLVAAYVGAKHAIAVSNAPGPVYIALQAADVGYGDEVILSAFDTYDSACAIELAHARCIFVDIDPISLNFDSRKIGSNATERTKIVLAVHSLGMSVEAAWVCEQAETYGLTVIEDAGGALGANVAGKRVGAGHLGRAACFRFGKEQAISINGGVITTSDDEFARRCREVIRKGAGEPLDEVSAATATGQLATLDETLARRQRIADHYRGRLRALKDFLILPTEIAGYKRAWSRFALIAREHADPQHFIDVLEDRGVQCGRPEGGATYLNEPFASKYGLTYGHCPIAEGVANKLFFVPFFTTMTQQEVDFTCDLIDEAARS